MTHWTKIGVNIAFHLVYKIFIKFKQFKDAMVTNVSDLFKGTVDTFGAIDIVFNNAGVAASEDWEKVIQINQVFKHWSLFFEDIVS